MKLGIKFYLLVITLTLLHISCSTPKALEYRDFKNFTVANLGFASSTIKMDLIYYNPNSYGLQLKRTDLDVYMEGSYIGHTQLEYQITIPKRSEFSIPISLDVDMKNLFKNAFVTILNKEVNIRITGTIKVGKANIFKSFPVNYSGKQQFKLT